MSSSIQRLQRIIATGSGGGFLPIAPGSWASAMAAIVAWWLVELPWWLFVVIVVALFFIAVWSVGFADTYYAQRTGKAHDNKMIVIDEWVGQLTALIPVLYFGRSIMAIAIGLFLFRAFDTAKFGLAGYFDRQTNAWGVIADDVVAGLHAALMLTLVLWIAQHVDALGFVLR